MGGTELYLILRGDRSRMNIENFLEPRKRMVANSFGWGAYRSGRKRGPARGNHQPAQRYTKKANTNRIIPKELISSNKFRKQW